MKNKRSKSKALLERRTIEEKVENERNRSLQQVLSQIESAQPSRVYDSRDLQKSGPVLTPAELLIVIHRIDPDRDGIPLKKVTDARNTCFEQRQIFTQQVLAKVLN